MVSIKKLILIIIAFVIILNTVIIPNGKYNDAVALMDAGKYLLQKAAYPSGRNEHAASAEKSTEIPLIHMRLVTSCFLLSSSNANTMPFSK